MQELPSVGDQIGGYTVGELLGQGGCAAVFRATKGDQQFALKVVLPAFLERQADVGPRFLREVNVAKRVIHPNVVRCYEHGQSSGYLWMAMELIDGPELEEVLRAKGPMIPPRAITLMLQVLDGLAVAHEKLIVHRDLKPANIMLVDEGTEDEEAKLVDFGIGKAIGENEDMSVQDVTGSFGKALFSPHYTAPECLKASAVGSFTDIYSMGLIFYELLVGEQAVAANTIAEVYARQFYHEPKMPEWLEQSPAGEIIKIAIKKDPKSRYPSAQEMRAAIAELDPVTIKQPGWDPFAKKKGEAPPMAANLLLAAAVLSVFMGVVANLVF